MNIDLGLGFNRNGFLFAPKQVQLQIQEKCSLVTDVFEVNLENSETQNDRTGHIYPSRPPDPRKSIKKQYFLWILSENPENPGSLTRSQVWHTHGVTPALASWVPWVHCVPPNLSRIPSEPP